MTLKEKLTILADSAKYDASCSSKSLKVTGEQQTVTVSIRCSEDDCPYGTKWNSQQGCCIKNNCLPSGGLVCACY